MSSRRWKLCLLAGLAAGVMSGCGPSRIMVNKSFWENRNAKIGVALAEYPMGGTHKAGAQGLLDMAINSALSKEMQDYMKKIELFAFEDIRDTFTEELRKRGLDAKVLAEKIDLEDFGPYKGTSSAKTHKKDLTSLKEKEGVDVLVLLSVNRFGTNRKYYGFIPLEAPKAFFEVQGQMIDLRDNKILWQILMPEKDARVPTEGSWDQPPDYPNLTAALRKAIENGKTYLHNEFFVKAQ